MRVTATPSDITITYQDLVEPIASTSTNPAGRTETTYIVGVLRAVWQSPRGKFVTLIPQYHAVSDEAIEELRPFVTGEVARLYAEQEEAA